MEGLLFGYTEAQLRAFQASYGFIDPTMHYNHVPQRYALGKYMVPQSAFGVLGLPHVGDERCGGYQTCKGRNHGRGNPSALASLTQYLMGSGEREWLLRSESMWHCLVALDCEMVRAGPEDKLELARITAVGPSGEVLLDEWVQPPGPIHDYLTEYSGVTEDMLRGVTTNLESIQKKLSDLLDTRRTILVGHALENDLHALRLMFPRIVDTSVLFQNHSQGRPSLRYLVKTYLGENLDRSSGHCSLEDARAALKLTLLKAVKGPSYGGVWSAFSQVPVPFDTYFDDFSTAHHILHLDQVLRGFGPRRLDNAAKVKTRKGKPLLSITSDTPSDSSSSTAGTATGSGWQHPTSASSMSSNAEKCPVDHGSQARNTAVIPVEKCERVRRFRGRDTKNLNSWSSVFSARRWPHKSDTNLPSSCHQQVRANDKLSSAAGDKQSGAQRAASAQRTALLAGPVSTRERRGGRRERDRRDRRARALKREGSEARFGEPIGMSAIRNKARPGSRTLSHQAPKRDIDVKVRCRPARPRVGASASTVGWPKCTQPRPFYEQDGSRRTSARSEQAAMLNYGNNQRRGDKQQHTFNTQALPSFSKGSSFLP